MKSNKSTARKRKKLEIKARPLKVKTGVRAGTTGQHTALIDGQHTANSADWHGD